MSHKDYILNLLNIKDNNIIFDNIIETEVIKNKTNKVISATLTYFPEACPCCGTKNEGFGDIIRWGYKQCKVKIPKISNCNSLLLLKKQRYKCKNCSTTFSAETSLVDKYKNISNNLNLFIKTELMTKSSETDIAKRSNISISSVERILETCKSNTELRHSLLPLEMNWDEFKATNDTKGKMAFMIMNNKNKTIFDILNSRKSRDLEKYFSKYQRSDRLKVKKISTDFYSGYIHLAKKYFKNADIVIDRFHIVTQVYVALNITRVQLCKKSNPNYNKLKKYWKSILKNKNKLSNNKHYSKNFRKEVSESEIVTYLINTDETLKANYNCYQGILNALEKRDFSKFEKIINHPHNLLSLKMLKALKLFRDNIKYIYNSFIYDINNGLIEGTNNLIKTIKRISFGYRKFDNLVNRVLLIKQAKQFI